MKRLSWLIPLAVIFWWGMQVGLADAQVATQANITMSTTVSGGGGGTVTGTGVAGQGTFWSGVSAISGDTGFLYGGAGAVTFGAGAGSMTLNTAGGTNAVFTEVGISKTSGATETFALTNPGAGVANFSADGDVSGATLTGTGLTTGSVLFSGAAGLVSQDNANLFWDDTNNRLGVGTATPAQRLDVAGTAQMTGFKLTTTPTAGFVLTSDAVGIGTWQTNGNGTVTTTGSPATTNLTAFSGATSITGTNSAKLVSDASTVRLDLQALGTQANAFFLATPNGGNAGFVGYNSAAQTSFFNLYYDGGNVPGYTPDHVRLHCGGPSLISVEFLNEATVGWTFAQGSVNVGGVEILIPKVTIDDNGAQPGVVFQRGAGTPTALDTTVQLWARNSGNGGSPAHGAAFQIGGGAVGPSASDSMGGDVILRAGNSAGNQGSKIDFQVATAGGTGSTVRTSASVATLTGASFSHTINISSATYSTATNCADSAGAAACGSAAAGAVVIDAAATTVVVSTTAVKTASRIMLQYDSSLGAELGVTCNTTVALPTVTARTAATSFTITVPVAPVTNPACYTYWIVN